MILRHHLCPEMHTLTKRADFVKVSEILVDVSQICKRVISFVELTILTIFIYSYNFLDNLGKISLESSLLPNSSFLGTKLFNLLGAFQPGHTYLLV